MAAPEDTQASLGGATPSTEAGDAEIDIAALYARLRREVRRTGAVDRDDGRSGARAAVRAFAERYWAVTAERPLERRPGIKGALALPLKKLLRPLMRWYVEPLAYEQRMFNDAALKLIDALWAEADTLRSVDAELRKADEDLAERSSRRLDEARFALSERIDEQARTAADAVSYLERLDDAALGGIFMGQVVEHLPAPMLVRVLELCAATLRPGGVLVAETINPLSPLALRNYFADLTHAQPLVPETLALLARQCGFRDVETRFTNPPERTADIAPEVAEILFAPLDYAIVARV